MGEQLKHLVEAARVRHGGADAVRHGPKYGGVRAEEGMLQPAFAGEHPVAVAVERVDFAVVRQHPERLGQFPGGTGVGAVALVEHRDGRVVAGVAEVLEEVPNLGADDQALVDDGARGERDHVVGIQGFGTQPALQFLAAQEEPLLRGQEVARILVIDQQQMLDVGHRATAGRAEHVAVERHVAPARHAEAPPGANRLGQHLRAMRAAGVMRVQEKDADGHPRRVDTGPSDLRVGALQQLAGKLCQDAGAIAGAGVGCDCASMRK